MLLYEDKYFNIQKVFLNIFSEVISNIQIKLFFFIVTDFTIVEWHNKNEFSPISLDYEERKCEIIKKRHL